MNNNYESNNLIFKNLKIQSFRGFQEISLSNLGKINLIVGTNNSGKTSLLEAIAIFCNPLDPFRWFDISQRRFSTNKTSIFRSRPSLESLQWIFNNPIQLLNEQEDSTYITIESEGDSPINKLESKLDFNYSFLGQGNEYGLEDENEKDVNTINNNTLEDNAENFREGLELKVSISLSNFNKNQENRDNQQSLDYQEDSFQIWENERFVHSNKRNRDLIKNALLSPSYSYSYSYLQVRSFSKLILKDKDKKSEILELMRLFDNEIRDLTVLSPSKAADIYIEHDKLGLIPIHIYGDGIKRTLAISLALQSVNDGVLLIDEIETSIHISALSKVFSWLVKACDSQNIQLFITTHSLEAVDAMIQSIDDTDDVVAFQLNNIDNSVKRFSGDLLSRLRLDRGLDIR